MAITLPDTHNLLSKGERFRLERFFEKFSAAIESPDPDSMEVFFAEESDYMENAPGTVQLIIMAVFKELGIVPDEEETPSAESGDVDLEWTPDW